MRRRAFATFGWTVAFLIALDFAVGALFPYPQDPRETNPGAVAMFFDYGRSMEGRLRRATRADPAQSAPITQAGWYEPLVATTRPAKPDGVEVTIYGMSHAMRLADALQAVSPRLSARSVGAPGATTNWSYGAFLRDQGRGDSKVAVLAIMSSTLPMITSPAPMNWNSSFALPYTADRFVLAGGALRRIPPPYDSFAEYVRTLEDPAAWESANRTFARTDPFYDPYLLRQTWLDSSTLVRMARRAWGQRRDRAMREGIIDARSFDPDSEAVRVANAIVADFARKARAQGLVPVIYSVDSFGYGDQLYRALADTLRRDDIPYLATHTVVDPRAPAGYLPDSHFTDANDARLARALERVIERELAQRETAR
jgi:hypothetical protein